MAEKNQLNTAWLVQLSNANHDGTTQQIYDYVAAYETENTKYNQLKQALLKCRTKEDEVWLKAQRDPAVKRLEAADREQDGYISATRYIIDGHAALPDAEPTKQEAKDCEQTFKDFSFSTKDPYGAESDKIIQIQQNLTAHEEFLTQIGAWTFLQKAGEKARLVREILGERALTKGEFVKGEMKAARRATDLAIADLYKLIMAMMELMPSDALTALASQLKGIELYARQYYIKNGSAQGGGSSNDGGGTSTEDPGTTDEPENPGTTDPDDPGTSGGGSSEPDPDPNTGTDNGDDDGLDKN